MTPFEWSHSRSSVEGAPGYAGSNPYRSLDTIALVPQVVDAVKLPVVVPVRSVEKNENVNVIQHDA